MGPVYDLRNSDDFAIRRPRTEHFKNFPSYSFVKTFNEFDPNKYTRNPFTFRYYLREFFLESLIED